MANPVYQNKAWTYNNIIQDVNSDAVNFVQEKTELIKCDTTSGPVDIILLPIGDYWDYEYKLYIIDSEGNGSTNNITIYAPDSHLINGQTGVTINNDYGSALIRVVDSTNYIAQFGKSFDQLIDITYNELYSKVVNGNLIPTQWYRLTDYKSVNFLNGWEIANNNPASETNFNPREIYTGENEVLIIQAVSKYEISPIGYSETYPNDIIQYVPYTDKIGVNQYFSNGETLPDTTTLTGFDLEWDGTNVYFNMPAGYPALFGHYFWLYCEFIQVNTTGPVTNFTSSGVSAGGGTIYLNPTITTLTGIGSGFQISQVELGEFSGDPYLSSFLIENNGVDYEVGDQLVIYGSQLGGVDGVNDLYITVTGIDANPTYYYQDGTYEPLIPGISVCQYPNTSDDPNYGYPKAMSRIRVENGGQKIVLLDLTEDDFNNYGPDTLEVETVYGIGNAYGWITRRQDTLRNIDVPFDFRGRKYRRFECEIFGNIKTISSTSLGPYIDGTYGITSGQYTSTTVEGNNAEFIILVSGGNVTNVKINRPGRLYKIGETFTINGTLLGGVTNIVITITNIDSNINYWGQGYVFNGSTSTGNYKDFKIFRNQSSSDLPEGVIQNVQWFDRGGPDMYYYFGYNDNCVFFDGVSDIKITGEECFNNTIDDNFDKNTINGPFNYNSISYQFSLNTINYYFIGNNIQNGFQKNKIGQYFLYNNIKQDFYDNVIGDYFSNNSISNFFTNNNIENYFYNNTIGFFFRFNSITGQYFYDNNIKTFFYQNTFESNSYYNTFGDNVFENKISATFIQNNIGNNFYKNNIGVGFGSNNIGDGFYLNTIGGNFQSNNILNNFSYNIVGPSFYNNNGIVNNFNYNFIKHSPNGNNFSTATHVYGDYTCDIYLRPDGQYRLSFYDNSDTLVITGITS